MGIKNNSLVRENSNDRTTDLTDLEKFMRTDCIPSYRWKESNSEEKQVDDTVSIFNSVKDPKVKDEISIESVLSNIKVGRTHKSTIFKARKAGKNTSLYDHLKTTQILTFSPNASFYEKRAVKNLKELTGLMYLDLDNCTELEASPFIYASWLSLSGTGRGILVRTKGVNTHNFKDAYHSVAKELGIEADPQCVDITRQVVLSYDPDIFINKSSQTFIYKEGISKEEEIESTNTPLEVALKKEKREKCDLKGGASTEHTRWNDLDNYDLKGKEYVIFDEKKYFSKAFVPQRIPTGRRHITVSSSLHQLTALNLNWSDQRIENLVNNLNSYCDEPLPKHEIQRILANLLKKKKSGDLKPIKNFPRYVIFSDKIPKKEKQSIGGRIGGKISGKIRREETIAKIQKCLNDWDIQQGKATNKAIAKCAGIAHKTMDKYSKQFKEQKEEINKKVKDEEIKNLKKEGNRGTSEEK
ncbi:BT4734/BF3469 family protein [Psychroflexus salinarum]|uniref:BT4734/BF3469 family protein n=1 Tax=Psychroflexus salinarum TaxID=546024 RepID=A0ABW3GL92_9FLAO